MSRISLREIIDATHPRVLARAAETFGGVCTDSRSLKAGELFVALQGERFDGHDFISLAKDRGAVGALVERAVVAQDLTLLQVHNTRVALGDIARYWRSKHALKCVAITGSNGKTTTKDFLVAICAQAASTLGTQGNLNNDIGLPLTLLGLKAEHRYAVLEMGMSARGEIAYLASVALPDIGVITNVAAAHIGKLGSLDAVAQAKGELFHAIGERGIAIFQSTDARLAEQAKHIPRDRQVLFGDQETDDVQLLSCEPIGCTAQKVQIRLGQHVIAAQIELPGRHNALNAVAACAAAMVLRVGANAIVRGLQTAWFSPHRSSVLQVAGRTVLDDCYNANPASMLAALDTLRGLRGPASRAIAVLGDMFELGADATRLHEELGRQAAGLDGLICVGELGKIIHEGAIAAGLDARVAVHTHDRKEAAQAALAASQPGDVILVKASRGMRLEEVIDHLKAEAR